eukprot:6208199-Pleurochrysis_carterae.AAC.1
MNRVEGDCAGRDSHALTWHMEPTAVPRDTFSQPSHRDTASMHVIRLDSAACSLCSCPQPH